MDHFTVNPIECLEEACWKVNIFYDTLLEVFNRTDEIRQR